MDIVKPRPSQNNSNKKAKRFNPKNFRPIVTVLAVVLAVWLIFGLVGSRLANRAIDRGLYQAVFLTNGQVYFGKLANTRGDFLDFEQIYYLQTPGNNNSSNDAETVREVEEAADIRLIKLGNELHGPTDRMLINKDQVLFWENMKHDSKVSEAIRKYQEENN